MKLRRYLRNPLCQYFQPSEVQILLLGFFSSPVCPFLWLSENTGAGCDAPALALVIKLSKIRSSLPWVPNPASLEWESWFLWTGNILLFMSSFPVQLRGILQELLFVPATAPSGKPQHPPPHGSGCGNSFSSTSNHQEHFHTTALHANLAKFTLGRRWVWHLL